MNTHPTDPALECAKEIEMRLLLGNDTTANDIAAIVRPYLQPIPPNARAAMEQAKDALEKTNCALREDRISAAIINAENKGRNYGITRDSGFISKRCNAALAESELALTTLRSVLEREAKPRAGQPEAIPFSSELSPATPQQGPSDTEMLNWLEEHLPKQGWHYGWKIETANHESSDGLVRSASDKYPTARSAIAAAMKAQKEGQP